MRTKLIGVIALCLVQVGGSRSANALEYQLTILSPVSGNSVDDAYGINDAGQVVGVSRPAANVFIETPTIWNGATPTALGTLGGSGLQEALGINNAGQVVGRSTLPDNTIHAVIWNGSTPTDLGTSGGFSEASAINNSGQVVGYNGDPHAVIWNGTTQSALVGFSWRHWP
jgi:probable HAF family extracellular repeat protein